MREVLCWSAVNTQPNKETLAASHLERQGYRVFFPAISKRVKHARKVFDRKVSLFPSYIFVQLDHQKDRWTPINGTIGVRHLVMTGSRPAVLPPLFVEQLGSHLAGAHESASNQYDPIEVGVGVRIFEGPFRDLVGTFESMTPDGRVRILLDMLGGKVPVLLERRIVMSAC